MKAQTPGKPNIINILLIACMVYLGYMLFTEPQRQAGQEKRTYVELKTAMEKQNADLLDVTIAKTAPAYLRKMNEEANKEAVSVEERERRDMAATILVADTMRKSGLYREKLGGADVHYGYTKISRAYDTIKGKFEKNHNKPIWDEKFPVAPASDLELTATEISPRELEKALVTHLQEKAKEQSVLGMIPGWAFIDFLVGLTGHAPQYSYWLAALFLAMLVRAIVWPLAQKQYMWGRQMGQLAPYMKEIKERFTDKKTKQITDQQAYTAETMKLYKEYGMNPFSGCGPAVIQIPLFLIVYQCMLLYKFEFTKGYFLWMQEGAGSFLNIPLAPNLGERDYIMVFLYGITMIISTLLQPVSDPSNAKQGRLMGIGIAVFFSIAMFFWPLPSAFVVYWTFTNILSTTQALIAYRMPLPPLEKKATVKGGSLPFDKLIEMSGQGGTPGKVDSSFFGDRGTPKKNKKKPKK